MMTEANDLPFFTADDRAWYERWQESEGLDGIRGSLIEDLRKVPLKPWKRKGGALGFYQFRGAGC